MVYLSCYSSQYMKASYIKKPTFFHAFALEIRNLMNKLLVRNKRKYKLTPKSVWSEMLLSLWRSTFINMLYKYSDPTSYKAEFVSVRKSVCRIMLCRKAMCIYCEPHGTYEIRL